MKPLFRQFVLLIFLLIFAAWSKAGNVFIQNNSAAREVLFGNAKMKFSLNYSGSCRLTGLEIKGQEVLSAEAGMYSFVRTATGSGSTLSLLAEPVIIVHENTLNIKNIQYKLDELIVTEEWEFTINDSTVEFDVDRTIPMQLTIEEAGFPSFTFNSISTWEGAFTDYGGLAWFYLFNSRLCTYGVHSGSSVFWNSNTGNGLKISAKAADRQVAMKYSRTNDDKLAFSISISGEEASCRYEAEQRSRFIRGKTDVWNSFTQQAGSSHESVTFSCFDYNETYNRGKFAGENGTQITALLNTIARIGVIDKKLFGGNSWHTPYGPICLHEQYIAQFAIGINDNTYTDGYKQCLDFYRDKAIQPDGRVISRWAYLNEDAMQGTVTNEGFYEAQWGYLMDSNPDFVTNVAELFNLTGDMQWVKEHKLSCEKALDYMLNRDSNKNYLVEMMTESQAQRRGSDWIDIIWASWENAFVNAKLYYALTRWAEVEMLLGDKQKADFYSEFAAGLKKSFNKPTTEGGFWNAQNKWYVHWIDKAQQVHGDNLVVPVNFMAVVYGICDDSIRTKAILDKIEEQSSKENLFFWPICLYPYAIGEGNDWQFPFPNYENGDIFLSWGSVGVEAYAAYKPELALKYVDNVLAQYEKDGLAFQRYGRVQQDGRGDDILSGNSLAVVGLYKAIYGINPLYNRLYLNPHLTAKLAGTELFYNFRDKKLNIGLSPGLYFISDKRFKVKSSHDFGFFSSDNQLLFFEGNSATYSLKAETTGKLTVEIINWSGDNCSWKQSADNGNSMINYSLPLQKPGADFQLTDGTKVRKLKTDKNGVLSFKIKGGDKTISVTTLN